MKKLFIVLFLMIALIGCQSNTNILSTSLDTVVTGLNYATEAYLIEDGVSTKIELPIDINTDLEVASLSVELNISHPDYIIKGFHLSAVEIILVFIEDNGNYIIPYDYQLSGNKENTYIPKDSDMLKIYQADEATIELIKNT